MSYIQPTPRQHAQARKVVLLELRHHGSRHSPALETAMRSVVGATVYAHGTTTGLRDAGLIERGEKGTSASPWQLTEKGRAAANALPGVEREALIREIVEAQS
jgi:hypothetical protein